VTQRDYEEQPEAPDLGQNVQEDTAETLVGPPDADPLDAGYVPPDRPYALDDEQVTTATDSLDDRLSRERPDVSPEDPSGGEAREAGRSGRLEAASAGADGSYDEGLDGRDTGIGGGAASAEEAAVHER
jgi:hypothetical protein